MGTKRATRPPRGGRSRSVSGQASAERGGASARRHYSPEERRQAVEAFHGAGLTQKAFARQWGVSAMTLWQWIRKYAEAGPKGLERISTGPVKRRGRAPMAAPVRAEIAAVQRRFPDFGLKKVRHFLRRFSGLAVSLSSVRNVRRAEGLPRAAPIPKPKRKPAPPRRFERAKPGLLWQSDITYLNVPWRKGPLYLIAFLDDHSRYVVGHGLFTNQRQEIVLEVFEEACLRFGKPKEVLTDQGRQYFSWRGKSQFQKLLLKEGVRHIVARAHHPQTVGKTERFWETLKRELWDRVHPKDLEEARSRIRLFVSHHNHQRPHQSLDGLVPADRFFGVADQVRKAMDVAIGKNVLRLALGEAPRKPVYLVGQIDGQSVSMHGEQGRLVVETSDGKRQEIDAKDLGSIPQPKETSDEQQQGDKRSDDPSPDDDAGAAPAAADGGGKPPAPAAPANGVEAPGVPGAEEDAGSGEGPVGVGEPGGAGAGAPVGDGDLEDVARQGVP